MKNLKKVLIVLAIILGVSLGIYSAIASTIPIAPAVFQTSLASPISTSSTTMTLTSGTLANGSTLSGYACFTVDSGNPNVEFICGTAAGTSVTSLLRGVDTLTGNTSVASLIFSHRRGADVKITDFPVFSVVRNIANGTDTFPNPITYGAGISPVGSQDLTTKAYVLSVVNGGAVTTNALVENGTAGETVSAGQVLYLKAADGRWWKADASTATTVNNVQLGISQGAGTAGVSITGGVLRRGVDTNQASGSAGALGYIKNSGGTVGTTTGTTERIIGNFITATTFNFNPSYYYNPTASQISAVNGSQGTVGSSNKLITQDNTTSAESDQSQTTQNATAAVGTASTTGLNNKIAQSFVPTKTKIAGVKLYKSADTGTFTGTITVSLQADSASAPSGANLATATITNAVWLDMATGEFPIFFSTEYTSLTPGNTYWIVISTSTADTSNHPNVGTNSAGGYSSGSVLRNNATDGWVAIATIDLYFKTINGITSQIVKTNSTGYTPVETSLPMRDRSYVYANSLVNTAATATITLTHNLGQKPTYVRATLMYTAVNATNASVFSQGVATIAADGTTITYNSIEAITNTSGGTASSTSSLLSYHVDGNGSQSFTISNVGNNTIDITHTKSSNPQGGTMYYIIEVFI